MRKIKFEHLQIGLIGQPNCGKSTIFNEVAGYRSVSSNFPGATTEYLRSHVNVCGQTFDIVDLPGIYSLTSLDPAAMASQTYLLTHHVDVLINVVDASVLGRNLELTLQLLDLEIPMMLCLNMMDEAERKGVRIDVQALSDTLGIPVIPATASKGKGVTDVFKAALSISQSRQLGRHLQYRRDVERVVRDLSRVLNIHFHPEHGFPAHLMATKLLEQDPYFQNLVETRLPELIPEIEKRRKHLSHTHGQSSDHVIDAERHALSLSVFKSVAKIRKPEIHWQERIDNMLMHPVWGYVSLILILLAFFSGIFRFGSWIETPLLEGLTRITQSVLNVMDSSGLVYVFVKSILEGIGGGMAIVLPYLIPFLMGLAFLEDIGYLPRVAFLMDAFMHRIGLHGTAIIPAVLGYGCNVPAVMATRILSSPRDRFIAALISTMVPCAARMTIIFGLVGAYMGGLAALGIYAFNLLVIALSGAVMSRLLPEDTPGMLMEIPTYKWPRLSVMTRKTWWRMKEFIVIAWPLLIAGSILLTLIDHLRWTGHVNLLFKPVTWLLGLPEAVGTTLIFGILRKELSMLMLFQAMGTQDLGSVLSMTQILVFTVFVVFYVPCVGTIGVLGKQIRAKRTLIVVLFTFLLALALALLTRGVAGLFSFDLLTSVTDRITL